MNILIRRLNRKLETHNRLYPDDHMVEIPKSEWPNSLLGPEKVFRSRSFLAQVFSAYDSQLLGPIVRVSVCRTALLALGRWKDQISWDDLQQVKTWVGLGSFDAIEVFPREQDVVDVANMRHLWVLLETRLDFAWRSGKTR